MASDSDSESDDDLARLREAVDCDTLRENLYSKKEIKSNIEDVSNPVDFVSGGGEVKTPNGPSLCVDDPKSMSDSIKAILKANTNKVKTNYVASTAPSLRRDRQDDSKPSIMSELDVTPQFQKFVGSKLDNFLDKQIKDVLKEKKEVALDKENELKLLKRSKVGLKEEVECFIKRPRPELLAHRSLEPTTEDLSACAVTGEFVISQLEVGGWVNKFAGRVEEGSERIKKKKKKVKKKKKKDSAAAVNVPIEKCL